MAQPYRLGLRDNGKGPPGEYAGRPLSLRATKWRSNLDREGIHAGLLRSAICRPLAMTGGPLTMTRRVVIASHEVAKQSRQRRPSSWIASLRSQ
ncbi:MAG: hypothetical protein LBT00_02910 [Spirochaetaceae bacterium]|nr:hypothetical protein [Spirochaetaceae bacterium]